MCGYVFFQVLPCSLSYLEFSIYHAIFYGFIDISIANMFVISRYRCHEMYRMTSIPCYMEIYTASMLAEGITCVFVRVEI